MLNSNDEMMAQERYADLRRAAEQHRFAKQNRAVPLGGRARSYDQGERNRTRVERWLHKLLRPGAAVHNQTAVNLREMPH